MEQTNLWVTEWLSARRVPAEPTVTGLQILFLSEVRRISSVRNDFEVKCSMCIVAIGKNPIFIVNQIMTIISADDRKILYVVPFSEKADTYIHAL